MAQPNTLPQPSNLEPVTAAPPTPPVPMQPTYQVNPAPVPAPVYVQAPVYQQVPAQPLAAPPATQQSWESKEAPLEKKPGPPTLRLDGHSSLFYWWPVWATGYIMALISYLDGRKIQIGNSSELFHTSSGPGVVFFLVLFLVILVTSVSVRGLASGMVILAAAFLIVLLAYFNLWDTILGWVGDLRVHLNCGSLLVLHADVHHLGFDFLRLRSPYLLGNQAWPNHAELRIRFRFAELRHRRDGD